MAKLQSKRFDEPDEVISHPKLKGQIVAIGETYVGRYIHEPSWCWSRDAKPLVGTPSCQYRHQGVALSGYLQVKTDEGAQRTIGPGEAFEIPPGHDAWVVGQDPWVCIEFLGVRWATPKMPGERVIATLLFTDIVGSTAVAARMGDTAWKQLLARHFDCVRLELDHFRGYEIAATGDGLFGVFDGTVRAVRCAAAICQAARKDGIEVRAGIHAGEVERYFNKVQGVAVHVAARIMALAGPGEILLSASTVALLEGAGLSFVDAGEHQLKGLEGRRRLYRFIAEPTDSDRGGDT